MPFNKPQSSKDFFEAFKDASVFDCGNINMLKIAQDAVVRGLGRNNHRTYFDKPKVLRHIWLTAHQTSKKPEIPVHGLQTDPKILVMVPPRFVHVPSNGSKLQYLGEIFKYLSRNRIHLLYTTGNAYCPIASDAIVTDIIAAYEHSPLEKWEKEFLKNLNQCFKRISSEAQFNTVQIGDIRVGFDEFWRKYRAVRKYLSTLKLTKALIIPGYQTEHIIAALRSLQIEVIELQHGVITTSSPFYCYPDKVKPVAHKALFADRIWVFGKFWKSELLKGGEYDESQIDILGDYFVRNSLPPENTSDLHEFENKFETRILVGTQTKRHEAFNQMVNNLSKKYSAQKPHVGILVKRHPAEKPELYAALGKLSNVMLVDASLDYLYPRCKAYVSMYSNTLFEAVRIASLQLFVLESPDTIDLVDGIEATGVATRIGLHDDPLEIAPAKNQINPNDFFASPINIKLLESLR